MPKIVNSEEKKKKIVEFAWKSIKDNGVKGMSIRNIAEEAGISPGQLRYYFPTHEKLLSEVMQYVAQKVEKRIKNIFESDMAMEQKVVSIILCTMPLDDERYADMEVWAAFQNTIHEVKTDTMQDDIKRMVEMILMQLNEAGVLKEDLNKELTVLKTISLIDGLSFHKLWTPNQISNEIIETIITNEVKSWIK